jgi:NitT/TauT family transport system permease protein
MSVTLGRVFTPRVRNVLAPVVFLVAFIALWQARVFNDIFGLETFAVPLPADILSAAGDNKDGLLTGFKETFDAALVGYVVGNLLGFVIALVLLALPVTVAGRFSAVCTAVQALPIIAIAPIVALYIADPLWFKATVVMFMVFPSMLVYAYRGMTAVDPTALELAASYRASSGQILRMIRLPNALPQVFTALKYTTVLALIGVVVCEILRSQDGLGFVIHDSLQSFGTSKAWAAVVVLSGTGVIAYLLLVLCERVFFPWSVRHGSD